MILVQLEAAIFLVWARMTLRQRAVAEVRANLGAQAKSPGEPTEGDCEKAQELGRMVLAQAARFPWNSTCLVQSSALMSMLRRRKIPAEIRFGVAKGSGGIRAHAWVECGGQVVLDTAAHEAYIPFDQG
jgi:hypothetical protein